MNLFIAVLTDNYDSAEAAEDDSGEEEVDQEEAVKDALKDLHHSNAVRERCLFIAKTQAFERFITVCILLNTVVMMMNFAPRTPTQDAYTYPVGELKEEYGYLPTSYFWTLWSFNTVLTIIFT